jgi:predicted nucleic acid-binding protein
MIPGRSEEGWPEGPRALFAGRILPFDERAGPHWARLTAGGKASGRPRNAFDMIIASIAAANDCVVATDDERISRTSRL